MAGTVKGSPFHLVPVGTRAKPSKRETFQGPVLVQQKEMGGAWCRMGSERQVVDRTCSAFGTMGMTWGFRPKSLENHGRVSNMGRT